MAGNEGITLTSNWNTLGDVDLLSIQLKNSSNDVDINMDDMSEDNCVCLIRNDKENSKAYLEIKVQGCISSISLMSEAQVIEVFGVNDEYLLTHTSHFFDEWEEMAVYYSKIFLPNVPVSKLKFTRTRYEDRVWIYGAQIHVQNRTNHHPEIPINFNVEQISRLLGNSNLPNTTKSHNFKKLLNSSLSCLLGKKLVPDNISTSSSTSMHSECNKESVVTDLLSGLLISASDSAESQKKCTKQMPKESSSWLTTYIDKKLNDIKTEILHEVDVKINNLREETNEKLNVIIYLLVKDL